MAFYKNRTEMFLKQAKTSKEYGDQYYQNATRAKEIGDSEKYQDYFARATSQYKTQEYYQTKAEENAGEIWQQRN